MFAYNFHKCVGNKRTKFMTLGVFDAMVVVELGVVVVAWGDIRMQLLIRGWSNEEDFNK